MPIRFSLLSLLLTALIFSACGESGSSAREVGGGGGFTPNQQEECEPFSEEEACDEAGFECAVHTVSNGCSGTVEVDCGDTEDVCGDSHICGASGEELGLCVCVPPSEEELCDDAGFECGEHTITDACDEERTVDCGDAATVCGDLETCGGGSADGLCGCTPESDADLCLTEAVECGPLTDVVDSCGEERTIDSCGDEADVCGSFETCGGGGTDGLCGCTPESDEDLCLAENFVCGPLTAVVDSCGVERDVDSCGDEADVCGDFQTCGGGGTDGLCGCTPESDEDLCLLANAECGPLTAVVDSCGIERNIDSCGDEADVCSGSETCGGGGIDNACGCTAESDQELCLAENIECGPLAAIIDSCGIERNIDSCGDPVDVCGEFETCGGGGVDGLCGCIAESDQELCDDFIIECGPVEDLVDSCGVERTFSCGDPGDVCGEFETCGGSGVDGVCGCTTTTCEAEGILCGTIPDGCGGELQCDAFCAEQISMGDQHGCAVGSQRIKCWGRNQFGQLGVGDTTNRQNPADVQSIVTARTVSSGAFHTCALLEDNSVRCWGRNNRGQLGVGSTVSSNVPSSTAIFSGALKVESGELHSCAIVGNDEDFNGPDGPETLPAGLVYCWGSNDHGQVGDPVIDLGSTVGVRTLVDLPYTDGKIAIDIAVGANHSCALMGTIGGDPREDVYCWGRNDFGQIIPRHANYSSEFSLTNTTGINFALGNPAGVLREFSLSACGTLLDFSVDIGIDHYDRTFLRVVLTDPNGTEHLLHNGEGSGADLYATYPFPDDPQLRDAETLLDWIGLDAAGSWSVRVNDTNNPELDDPPPTPRLQSVSLNFACAEEILAGNNATGGISHAVRIPVPLAIDAEIDRPRYVSAGQQHTCVLDDDTEDAVCWGAIYDTPRTTTSCNTTMNLYTGSGAPSNTTTNVNPTFCSILPREEDSNDYFFAINYNVQTNGNQQLQQAVINGLTSGPFRIPFKTTPAAPDQLSPFSMVSGANHICAIVDLPVLNRSNIYCLGNNRSGQVGDGTDNNWYFTREVNRDVNDNIVDATQVSLGLDFSCALLTNNNVQCWGNNQFGQIGNSDLLQDESLRPFDVRLQVAD